MIPIIYHLRFLVPQILLLMFDHFILIILQVLILYSTTHLKLHSPLRPLKICLRLWIHLCVNPYAFIHLQSYKIFLILVILHHLLLFQLLFIVALSSLSKKRQFLILFDSKLWMRNLLLCIRSIFEIQFLYLLVRVLLVDVRCITFRNGPTW